MQIQSLEMAVSCPSFSTYSDDSIADTAARVSRDDFTNAGAVVEDGDEFEFVSTGDEVFLGGAAPIGPVFPVFNRDVIFGDKLGFRGGEEDETGAPTSSSSSSSEADELDGIPEGTYCVWTPKRATASPEKCRKSNSTGSSSTPPSKRWRFSDLLRRSHSDGGKESLVFLTPSVKNREESAAEKSRRSDQTVRIGSAAGKGSKSVAAAHEVFYARNRALNRTAEKRRTTFLPYRQDLVGFFASVNTMGRTFPPF